MSGLKQSDLDAAAARVSSDASSTASRGSGGARSSDAAWEVTKGRTMRALIADPDLLMYFAYLVSNRACALAQKVAAELSEMVVYIEGQKYVQAAVAAPTRLQSALATTSGRTAFTTEDVARLTAETDAYVKSVAPQIARSGRAQKRGPEAQSAYTDARTTLASDWKLLRQALDDFSTRRMFAVGDIRSVALATPLASLTTTSTLLDPTNLTDFTVQLAAAAAAVAAMGRDVDLKTRLRTGSDSFPESSSVTVSDTTLTPSASPAQLGIKSGDIVQWDGGSTTVTTVSDTTVTTAAAAAAGVPLQILSAPYVAWESANAAVASGTALVPAGTDIVRELRAREGDLSAARIRGLMEYAAKLAVILDTLSSDATDAIGRVGGTVFSTTQTPLASTLRAFAPTFGAKTKQAGDSMLRDLEGGGFDYAVELLYRGDVATLLNSTASQLSFSGRLADAVSGLRGARGLG